MMVDINPPSTYNKDGDSVLDFLGLLWGPKLMFPWYYSIVVHMTYCISLFAGMCELIMINEDLDKEIKSDHKFSKKSLRLVKRL